MFLVGSNYNPTPEQRAADDRNEASRLAMIAKRNKEAMRSHERRFGSRAITV